MRVFEDISRLLDQEDALTAELEAALEGDGLDALDALTTRYLAVAEDLVKRMSAAVMTQLGGGLGEAEAQTLRDLRLRHSAQTERFAGFIKALQSISMPDDEAAAGDASEVADPEHPDAADLGRELEAALAGGPLEGREIIVLAVPDSHQAAYAIKTSQATAYNDRRWLCRQPRPTPWLPIVTTSFVPAEGSWADAMLGAGLLDRFSFDIEAGRKDTSAAAILERASKLDAKAAVAALASDRFDRLDRDWDAHIDEELAACRERFGVAPPRAPLLALASEGHPELALEQRLLQWQRQQGLEAPEAIGSHLTWFEPPGFPTALLLLPIARPADALAHVHWFGAGSQGNDSATMVALLRAWEHAYGATLVAHFGTILHFEVERPPMSLSAAWEPAFQQVTVAECTTVLSGVPLRDHAASLVGRKTWFLHERP